MPKISVLSRSNVDKQKDTKEKVKDVAKSTYASALDTAQSTYAGAKDVVQSGVQSGFTKTQAVLLAGLTLAQGLMKFNQKRSKKKFKKARQTLLDVQDTLQQNLKPRWNVTQAALQAGMEAAQETLTKSAQKNLKKAQKNLQSVQEILGTNLARTQDLLGEGSKRASRGLQQAASSAVDMKEAMREQYASYQRKRQRGRSLFRWGLIVGIVLALLYTPYPGAEVRRRLFTQWEQLRSYVRSNTQS